MKNLLIPTPTGRLLPAAQRVVHPCLARFGSAFNRLRRWTPGVAGSLVGVVLAHNSAMAAPTLYTIGDSTVQSYTSGYYPRAGWGQVLPHFFDATKITITNKAVGGTSSKSFYDYGYWTSIKNVLKAGDYVTIQFGINDSASDTARHTDPFTTFQDYLTIYVNEARAKGAFPILVSTQNRNAWTSASPPEIYPAYHDYPVATRQLASELNVPLIDLDQRCTTLLESVGKTYSTNFIYNHYLAGEWPNYPNGASDDVHFQEMGAIEMAKLVVAGIRALSDDANVSKLIPFLKPTYPVTFNSNNAPAGTITRSESFPAGITVTAYVWPNSGYTFQNWSGDISGTKRNVPFTMGTAAKTITANFSGGSGGNALQAENASYGGGVSMDSNSSGTGFNGSGFANFPTSGGYVQFNSVRGSSGGTHTLAIRHALGVSATRTGLLIVNGVSQSITFSSTGAWTTWSTHNVTISLNSGTSNTIRFESNGQDLSNLDQVTVTPTASADTYQAESAAIAGGVTIDSNNSGYNGTGFANFPTNGGTLTFNNVDGNGGGTRSLAIRYANGGASARAGNLTVNGSTSTISFPTTGSFGTWATLNVNITLSNTTTNTIRLASTGSDLANVDEIRVP